jgi:hypothetical protein
MSLGKRSAEGPLRTVAKKFRATPPSVDDTDPMASHSVNAASQNASVPPAAPQLSVVVPIATAQKAFISSPYDAAACHAVIEARYDGLCKGVVPLSKIEQERNNIITQAQVLMALSKNCNSSEERQKYETYSKNMQKKMETLQLSHPPHRGESIAVEEAVSMQKVLDVADACIKKNTSVLLSAANTLLEQCLKNYHANDRDEASLHYRLVKVAFERNDHQSMLRHIEALRASGYATEKEEQLLNKLAKQTENAVSSSVTPPPPHPHI